MADCRPHGIQLAPDVRLGFAAASRAEGLTDPLRYRLMTRAGGTLYFAIFRVGKEHLQPLSHAMSLFDSCPGVNYVAPSYA